MKRKAISMLMAVSLAAAALTACGSSSSTSGAGISPPAVLSLPELFWLLDALFSISCLLQLPITSMGSNRLTKTFFIVHVF